MHVTYASRGRASRVARWRHSAMREPWDPWVLSNMGSLEAAVDAGAKSTVATAFTAGLQLELCSWSLLRDGEAGMGEDGRGGQGKMSTMCAGTARHLLGRPVT